MSMHCASQWYVIHGVCIVCHYVSISMWCELYVIMTYNLCYVSRCKHIYVMCVVCHYDIQSMIYVMRHAVSISMLCVLYVIMTYNLCACILCITSAYNIVYHNFTTHNRQHSCYFQLLQHIAHCCFACPCRHNTAQQGHER